MKISKLKALTIATSVIGAASLGSVIGLTTVAATDQTSQNQNYSQTGNGSDNNLTPSNPENPPVDNNPSSGDQVTDIQKLFTNQRTIQPNEKVFDGLDQIKTINDLWQFYPKPANIPSNFNIVLDNVTTTTQTPDLNLGLQVKITINGNTPATFVIYGFSPYTDQDYKRIFEAANPSGKFMKDGKYFPYLDWRVLSLKPNDPNYFANYFTPVIPRELSANNIVATPESFNLLPGQVVNYKYLLHTQSYDRSNGDTTPNSISIEASVPVSTYYEYQYPNADTYKPVTKNWKPVNFDFIKANLPANYTRADFDKVVWQRWNGSTLADAINAYRYWYLFDQSNLTSKLESYILKSTNYTSIPAKYPIGWIIRGGNATKEVNISPTYDASAYLNGDKSYLNFFWHLHNWQGNDLAKMLGVLGLSSPWDIDAGLYISFDSKKPDALNKNGLVQLPVTVTTDINYASHKNPKKVYKFSQVVKKWNWTVLDALYYYFKNSSSLDSSYSTPFFSQFLDTLKKFV